jgi:CRISPR-associated protein Csm5
MTNHLQSFTLKLKALSPVFIGSGREITKKEYIYIVNGQRIIMPDYTKFAHFLDEKNLINDFTDFMTSSQSGLFFWLSGKGIKPEDISRFAAYEVYAGDAIIPLKPFRGVQLFIKDNYGKPYIPGSSLKGAIRSAILAKMANDNKTKSQKHYQNFNANLEHTQYINKNFLKRETEEMEADFLHTLDYKNSRGESSRKSDAINSVMKGLQVSDSEPLNTNVLVLCAKRDIKPNGMENALPICRECIKPETEITFMLTIDSSILSTAGIDLSFIKSAIAEFAAMQVKYFSSKFRLPQNMDSSIAKNGMELYLGGGAGFVSKTVIYPLGGDVAIKFVGKYMASQFKIHKHKFDEKNGVSPHMLKCTSYM